MEASSGYGYGILLKLLSLCGLLFVCAACTPQNPSTTMAAPEVAASGSPIDSYRSAIPVRGKFVLVDVPTFELIAYQDGAVAFRSRVIVGRPSSPTPELTSSMYAIRFNPAWSPTPYMIRNEGARYMPPGPRNPLGRILFELDNDQLVYLHDTNERALFDQAERALSHGCIRVEQARRLASWALGVPLAEVDAMVSRGSTFSVPLPEPIPVSLVNDRALSLFGTRREEARVLEEARGYEKQDSRLPRSGRRTP